MASAVESRWEITEKGGRALSLLVQLRQRSYLWPWTLFLFAEGTDTEVRVHFHTHVVLIDGAGLTALLADLANQMVHRIVEPDRTAKFTQATGPQVAAVSVIENK